jgi:hypothetical protein
LLFMALPDPSSYRLARTGSRSVADALRDRSCFNYI